MSYYLSKYKGIYRLKTAIDETINDFPTNLDREETREENDVYIDCRKGQISHYGRNILQCYVSKLGVGRNVLKELGSKIGINIEDYCSDKVKKDGTPYLDKEGKPIKFYDYEKFYQALENEGTVFYITETDEEVFWRFKAKDIALMCDLMQAKTSGANISPFSTKNLSKTKYNIPTEELDKYKKIVENIGKDNLLIISRIIKNFITTIPKKHKEYKKVDLNKLQRQQGLKSKEFIHSLGYWEEFLKYLEKEVDKIK